MVAKDLEINNVKQIVAKNNLEEALNKKSEEQLDGKSSPLSMFSVFETIFEVKRAAF